MLSLSENICPLCGRIMAEPCNRHHLLPLSKGGKAPAILLHKICHDEIHAVFAEMELKKHYTLLSLNNKYIIEQQTIQQFKQSVT